MPDGAVPLRVEVMPNCSGALATREERRLAMERACQQGRATGFTRPDESDELRPKALFPVYTTHILTLGRYIS